MIRAIIVGATGYAGAETFRMLANHPLVSVVGVTSNRAAGTSYQSHCPWLQTDLVLEEFNPEKDADVFFLCQEAGFAGKIGKELATKSKVIDFSADFRLKEKAIYESTYQLPWAGFAPYGLPELTDRDMLRKSNLIANPGCYPTATLLGLMPLVQAGCISGTPVIDAKSGASGAGRSRTETDYLLTELGNSLKGYALTGHRHVPEISQMAQMNIRFSPHLLDIPRGLEATLHVPVRGIKSKADLIDIFKYCYKSEPFVQVVDSVPSTKQVLGSNRCDIWVGYEESTSFAIVSATIDNLGKGAAGQAIQNMNLMLGFPETTGLPVHGVWP